MSLLEVGMLLCFGASWPFSIARLLRSRDASGKSPAFLGIILAGYACGIGHKVTTSADWVLLLYVLNFCMVCVDLWLSVTIARTLRNRPSTERVPSSVDDDPQISVESVGLVSGLWSMRARAGERRSRPNMRKWQKKRMSR